MRITGVILAGGRGTRMGGVEKGLLDWQGRPLIAHLIDALAPQVDSLMLNVNRAHERYASFDLPLIGDAPELAGLGPLAGLHSALSHSPTELVVCVPCDLPELPYDLVQRLLAASQGRRTSAPLSYVTSGGRTYPTLCLCHVAWREPLAASLRQGHCAAWRWFDAQQAGVADLGVWVPENFNTPESLLHTKKTL
ncbi:MAG TPA: molybdenum cofactor guanylyltransferase [bacterium]|nr:molybdenum cofactor guanylyltransferase [bacterium]